MWARTDNCIFNFSLLDVLTVSDHVVGESNQVKQFAGLSMEQLDIIWDAIREGKRFIDLRKV